MVAAGLAVDALAVAVYLAAWIPFAAVVATRAGFAPAVAQVGFGPVVWRATFGATELRLGALPLGGSLSLPPDREEEGFPLWILVVPHAVLGLLGAAAALALAPGALAALFGWFGGLLTFRPVLGGFTALVAGSAAVAANPVGWIAAIGGALGSYNAALGLSQGLARRAGTAAMTAWAFATAAVVLVGLGRALWLDVAGVLP